MQFEVGWKVSHEESQGFVRQSSQVTQHKFVEDEGICCREGRLGCELKLYDCYLIISNTGATITKKWCWLLATWLIINGCIYIL